MTDSDNTITFMEYVKRCSVKEFCLVMFAIYNKGWFDKSDHVDNEGWIYDCLPYMNYDEALKELCT